MAPTNTITKNLNHAQTERAYFAILTCIQYIKWKIKKLCINNYKMEVNMIATFLYKN